MNRVWKIIEERKSSKESPEHYGMYARKGMYGRKESGTYEEGVYDGIYAAIAVLEEHIKEMQKD